MAAKSIAGPNTAANPTNETAQAGDQRNHAPSTRHQLEGHIWHLNALTSFIYANTGGSGTSFEDLIASDRDGIASLLRYLATEVSNKVDALSADEVSA